MVATHTALEKATSEANSLIVSKLEDPNCKPYNGAVQVRWVRQILTRPFCGLWQVLRRRGVCCREQRRRVLPSTSVVMP